MKAVLFIARVAFILNLMFLVYFVSYMEWFAITNKSVIGFVLATGFILPILVNAILFSILLIRLMTGRGNRGLPLWLLAANFLLYAFQILFFAFT